MRLERITVTRYGSRGTPFVKWLEAGMPKIPSNVLDCVFYLYRTREDADAGTDYGGTGFLAGVPSSSNPSRVYVHAVTNWHVAMRDGCSVIRMNLIGGGTETIELDPADWTAHPDGCDVAISPPISLDFDVHRFRVANFSSFATKEAITMHKIGVGDDVFMVGRFIDHDGGPTNAPAARFGNISVMPSPVKQPTGKRRESYCIDMHSRSGYSGSPVFVFRTPATNIEEIFETKNVDLTRAFLLLLGIHFGSFPEMLEVSKDTMEEAHGNIIGGKHVKGLSGMAAAIPAWQIMELLNIPEMQKLRDDNDIELERQRKAGGGRSAPLAESASPLSGEGD